MPAGGQAQDGRSEVEGCRHPEGDAAFLDCHDLRAQAVKSDRHRGGGDGYLDRYGDYAGGPRNGYRYQGENRGFDRSAMNQGDWQAAPPASGIRPPNEAEIARIYQQSLRDLAELRQALTGSPGTVRDIQDLLAEMQRIDPSRFPGNPELLERCTRPVNPSFGC